MTFTVKTMNNKQKVDNYSSRQGKMAWAKSLKKGDLVEDCRYRIVRIKEIRHDLDGIREGWPKMILNILRVLPLPINIWFWLDCYLAERFPKGGYQDTMLVLEDGGHCSAMSCCDSLEVAKLHKKHDEQEK